MILTIIAVSNAVSVVALIVFLIFGGRQRELPAAEGTRDRSEGAERSIPLAAPAVTEMAVSPPINPRELDYSGKVRLALTWLEGGADPDVVAGELGFSGSEMGILVASAERAVRRALQNESSPLMQK
jgi:hypothetical protein